MTKHILITGGCGFIGSNFINYFHQKYPECMIVNYDKVDYCSNPEYISNKDYNYVLVKSDLNNTHILMTTLKSYQIDTVIHFAAQSHVDNSFGNSIQFTIDNILGTHNLLECCRVYGNIKKFIHISTDEVYGEVDLNHEGCDERSLLNPTNPYAATKAGAEFLVRSYHYSYKLPIIITRGNNVYGPGQYPEKLIPKFITSLLKSEKCTIHGKGESRRNFIYVDDVSDAVETILFKGQIGHTYNIGTNNEYSVLEIFDILRYKLDKSKDLKEFIEDRLFNDYRYSINSESLRGLGWNEKISFEEGLEKTIDWIKNTNL
jgi:UDP-glucose 4,6-dehydratase